MLKALRDLEIAKVRRRFAQGDCPQEQPSSVETLENIILDLASPSPVAAGGERQLVKDLLSVAERVKTIFGAGDVVERARAYIAAPTAPNDDLRAALEPFAREADEWDGVPDHARVLYIDTDEEFPRVTVADFRRARAALGERKA